MNTAPDRAVGGTGRGREVGSDLTGVVGRVLFILVERDAPRHLLWRGVDLDGAAEAAAASGLSLDGHVVAVLNGDQITPDPQAPLVAGDSVSFLSADARRIR